MTTLSKTQSSRVETAVRGFDLAQDLRKVLDAHGASLHLTHDRKLASLQVVFHDMPNASDVMTLIETRKGEPNRVFTGRV